jgi:hypothetical protein
MLAYAWKEVRFWCPSLTTESLNATLEVNYYDMCGGGSMCKFWWLMFWKGLASEGQSLGAREVSGSHQQRDVFHVIHRKFRIQIGQVLEKLTNVFHLSWVWSCLVMRGTWWQIPGIQTIIESHSQQRVLRKAPIPSLLKTF